MSILSLLWSIVRLLWQVFRLLESILWLLGSFFSLRRKIVRLLGQVLSQRRLVETKKRIWKWEKVAEQPSMMEAEWIKFAEEWPKLTEL